MLGESRSSIRGCHGHTHGYEQLKFCIYQDDDVPGEAAGLAMGLSEVGRVAVLLRTMRKMSCCYLKSKSDSP